ncbi:MAG TPA: hypothetical protein VN086_03165 [Candidatus Paceibacterota bacterium]|nr:hypothetical protein [Candidatus Paceibacterota bacterium]
MNSPTHHANIVKPQYTRVGYAVAQGVYDGRQTTFVVQEFATKPTDETVTTEPKPANPVTQAVQKVVAAVAPGKTAQPEPVTVAGSAAETSQVAGTESGVTTSASSSTENTGQPMILASNDGQTTTSDSWLIHFLKQVAASPLATSIYLLGGLAIVMALLLIFALTAHKNVRFMEVLGGGLIVIIFALSVLMYNAFQTQAPVVPATAAATTTTQ